MVAHASARKINEITKHWKSVTNKTLIVCILRLYIDELKWRINSEWAAVSHVVERAVGELRQRLRACVSAAGGHDEHML